MRKELIERLEAAIRKQEENEHIETPCYMFEGCLVKILNEEFKNEIVSKNSSQSYCYDCTVHLLKLFNEKNLSDFLCVNSNTSGTRLCKKYSNSLDIRFHLLSLLSKRKTGMKVE